MRAKEIRRIIIDELCVFIGLLIVLPFMDWMKIIGAFIIFNMGYWFSLASKAGWKIPINTGSKCNKHIVINSVCANKQCVLRPYSGKCGMIENCDSFKPQTDL